MQKIDDHLHARQQLTMAPGPSCLDFQLPARLEADAPPEARGLARDGVRLMVSHYEDDRVRHATFRELSHFLRPGDVLAINTSGTMNAALPATRSDGSAMALHLSTRLPADLWSVELRQPQEGATKPYYEAVPGETLSLPGGGVATLHTPYNPDQRRQTPGRVRLWLATLRLPQPLGDYLQQFGYPIRYGYVHQQWPLSYYQTIFATETGSAEMPSAGRAFTPALVTKLMAEGVQFAPLILHTGVASLEDHEPPYEEYYRVSPETARLLNGAREEGRRIVAVGTTVVRALETVTAEDGTIYPGQGWTDVVIGPQRGVRAIDGLLTGLHEPQATHLAMLEALAGAAHLCITYQEALSHNYLWHEFGDLHLILP